MESIFISFVVKIDFKSWIDCVKMIFELNFIDEGDLYEEEKFCLVIGDNVLLLFYYGYKFDM